MVTRMKSWCVVFMLGVGLAACSGPHQRKAITRTRTLPAGSALPRLDATSAERFGLDSLKPEPQALIEWDVPEGWRETPPKPMRLVNFQVGQAGDAEVYVTLLKGDGGGVESNINRWRVQMGQVPLGADAVAKLPTLVVLQQPAPMVEVAGTYTEMAGEAHTGYVLAGVVCLLEERAVFIKLIGPEDSVRPELARFRAFCESLR